MWFSVFCKFDYHLYVQQSNLNNIDVIWNCLTTHCTNTACKIVLLKAVIFSNDYCYFACDVFIIAASWF